MFNICSLLLFCWIICNNKVHKRWWCSFTVPGLPSSFRTGAWFHCRCPLDIPHSQLSSPQTPQMDLFVMKWSHTLPRDCHVEEWAGDLLLTNGEDTWVPSSKVFCLPAQPPLEEMLSLLGLDVFMYRCDQWNSCRLLFLLLEEEASLQDCRHEQKEPEMYLSCSSPILKPTLPRSSYNTSGGDTFFCLSQFELMFPLPLIQRHTSFLHTVIYVALKAVAGPDAHTLPGLMALGKSCRSGREQSTVPTFA